jgi:hypothetical protein
LGSNFRGFQPLLVEWGQPPRLKSLYIIRQSDTFWGEELPTI